MTGYQETQADLLEKSDIGRAIYYRLDNNWFKIFIFNTLYQLQALIFTNFILAKTKNDLFLPFLSFDWTLRVFFGMGCFLTLIEILQIFIKGKGYFTILNLIEFSANVMVIVNFFSPLNKMMLVIMGLLLYYKMMMSLTIIYAFRSLIAMIISCIVDMVPFLTILILMTVSFGILNLIEPYTEDDKPRAFRDHLND